MSETINKKNRKTLIEFIVVFLSAFAIYSILFLGTYLTKINDKALQSEDILPTAVLPFSILKEGNLNLDEYYNILIDSYPNPDNKLDTPYYLKLVDGRYYSFFPQFTAFIATPVYIIPALLDLDTNIETFRIMSRFGGAFITSLSVAVFWLILKKQSLNEKLSLLLLIVYALGTNSLSISSQGLWQHGTSQLFLSLGLLAIISSKYKMAGLSFGLAFITRPTNLLSLAVFGIYILFVAKNKKKAFAEFSIFAFFAILFEIIIDTLVYGSFFNTGYAGHTSHFTYNALQGFLGMWISPSKGILTCSPVFIFIFYAIYKSIKKHSLTDINLYLIGIIFVHTLIVGKWYNWFGGYSWGYRMASDLIPYMVFLLIPFVTSKYFASKIWRFTFYISLVISIFVHMMGVIYFDGVWHTIFDGKSKYWLWSIKDSQLIFSIKRGLFKMGLIENPIPLNYRVK